MGASRPRQLLTTFLCRISALVEKWVERTSFGVVNSTRTRLDVYTELALRKSQRCNTDLDEHLVQPRFPMGLIVNNGSV
jgi:hypothetical protein